MLVLLPPSESKAPAPPRGLAVDLASLSFPSLTTFRRQVAQALVRVSRRPDASQILGTGPALADQVAGNTGLFAVPAMRVSALYTGVLYDALDWAGLPPQARRRGAERLIVMSALWGALRPGDRVPPYRLSIGTDLPGTGRLAAAWRPVLGPALEAAAGPRGVIVDCRSAAYAKAWTPSGAFAARTVAIRVLREGPGGRRPVSHLAKHTRGEVARHLLVSGQTPAGPQELAEALGTRWQVELGAPARPGHGWTLDVILPGGLAPREDEPAGSTVGS